MAQCTCHHCSGRGILHIMSSTCSTQIIIAWSFILWDIKLKVAKIFLPFLIAANICLSLPVGSFIKKHKSTWIIVNLTFSSHELLLTIISTWISHSLTVKSIMSTWTSLKFHRCHGIKIKLHVSTSKYISLYLRKSINVSNTQVFGFEYFQMCSKSTSTWYINFL